MALKRSANKRTFGGGGSTTYSGGGSSRMGLEEYTARLEASHRLQVERSMISNENIIERAALSSEMSMARWLSQQQVLVSNKRDTEALTRIGQGDAAYGMTYAKKRMEEAEDEDDFDYWKDIYKRAKERAEDDYVKGLVESGDMEAKDLLPILQKRRDGYKVGSPGYLATSKEIGELNTAIKAEAFNKEIATAQAKYTSDGDKKALMGSLLGLYGRAKETTARTQLATRITNLQKELDTEDDAKRQAGITKRVADYYADRGANPASGVLFALAEAVNSAKTPAEAQRLITLAQSITSRERTLQQDALRGSGGGSGGGGGSGTTATKNAIDKEIADERANYKNAYTEIKEKILDKGGIPTEAQWAIFWGAGDEVRTGLQSAVATGGVTTAAMTTYTNELLKVETTDRETLKDQAGTNVVAKSQRLQTLITSGIAARKDSGEGVAAGIEATAALVRELNALQQSPFIAGSDKHGPALATNITEAMKPIVGAFNDAKQFLAPVVNGEVPPLLLKEYEAFKAKYVDRYVGKPVPPFAIWYEGMGMADVAERAQFLAPSDVTVAVGDDIPAGVKPSDKIHFDNVVASLSKQHDSSLQTARKSAAVMKGHLPDAYDKLDAGEVLSGRVDMEKRRAQRLAGQISDADMAAIEASQQAPGRTPGGSGASGKAYQPEPGILGGANQYSVLDALFADPEAQAQPTGYEQPIMDDTDMGGGPGPFNPLAQLDPSQVVDQRGYPPMTEDQAYQVDSGERARNARSGLEGWSFDTGEEGWMNLVGSNPERSAYDYLDSTVDLSEYLGSAVLPDEDEEFPFLAAEEASQSFDMPDFPFAIQEHEYEQPEPDPEPEPDDEAPTGFDRPTILA